MAGSEWSQAMQILRGDILLNAGNHHRGMARLKALFGDPRPPGMQLSLTVVDGPGVYWGYDTPTSRPLGLGARPVLLSRNVDDYAWETHSQNTTRREEQKYWKLEKNC